MKSLAFFLAVLTLAAGCVLEDKPVIPADGGVEAGPCGVCELETPICNDDLQCVECTAESNSLCLEKMLVCKTDAFECVECNASSDCNLEKMLVCKTDAFECVECNASSDCNDPAAAGCNTELNECEECQSEADCIGIEGRLVCDDGTCVECTPATEGVDCGETSCDPLTRECTETTVGSRETCETCVADSECGVEGNRCVPMTYDGLRYPNNESGFCLKSIDLGGSCTNPYRIVITRTSLSGVAADDYCGINEDLTTCQAVRALLGDLACDPVNGDQDCPQPAGLCRELPGILNRCTYLCSDVVECKSPPAPGSTCGASGSGGDKYCGG
jgi:hypothetical protein